MQIDRIIIHNVKGIQDLEINQSILPNRPNILVAPNGFGKSSIAIAFKSLELHGINLSKENRYQNKDSNLPSMSLNLSTNVTLSADESTNTISTQFSTFVVNSQIKANAKPQRIGARINPNASLEIEPTVVLQNVPSRQLFEYNHSQLKSRFGNNRKIVSDISELYCNPNNLSILERCVNFHAFDLVTYNNSITAAISRINAIKGTGKCVKEQMVSQRIIDLTPEFNLLRDKIATLFNLTEESAFLAAWQYIEVHKSMKAKFAKAVTYSHYLSKKLSLDETLAEVNPVADRFRIQSDDSTGQLVVKWPKATQISNGQRDLMTFITRLMACEFSDSNACILIIDEIFDYLDDANLVTFQYYISKLINKFKKSRRIIIPILLTHLDPNYLKHFCFNDTKLNVIYLQKTRGRIGKETQKLILVREADDIKDILDEYYFHYNPNIVGVQFPEAFACHKLNTSWDKPESFLKKVNRQNRYFHLEPKEPYDPIMVCLATRIQIEHLVYDMLGTEYDKREYLKKHGTKNKLLYAQECGVVLPETYFLLGIVYNHPLHEINGSTSQALSTKLENISIMKMLRNLWS